MKVVEEWKNNKNGKIYQVRQYEDKELWVDLGCGWFKSDYELEDLHINRDFERV